MKLGIAMAPVERAELVTKDTDLIADLISRLYVKHAARFRCDDPDRVDGEVRSATVGELSAGVMRLGGFGYDAAVDPADAPTAVAVTQGSGVITSAREELRFTRGDVLMVPADRPSEAVMDDAGYVTLQVPWPAAASLAEERTGTLAADLRFEAMAPISAARQVMWAKTADFICAQLVTSGVTEVSPLMAGEMTRLAAAVMLETFPNTTMARTYFPDPGWVPPAAVRRAAAFIEASADGPVTLTEIAAAAGVTSRALQYAFRRHYGTTPTGYVRRVRLEHAHRELRDADPAAGTTVAKVARTWGWANPSHFTSAYRRQFGQLPGQTLRT
jgi:AraC-like DNA-binding protein